MTIYEYNESPCIVDGDIVKHLPRIQRAYINNTDCFVYYRKDSNADECGVDIVLANWDGEDTFSTIAELKSYMKEIIKSLWNDLQNGLFDKDDWLLLTDGDIEF